jgi:hypothetical protein
MKASLHLLVSSLVSLSLATAGAGAQAELLRADSGASAERERINAALAAAVYVVVQFWPLFLIGGTAVVAIKASNGRSS